MAIKNVEASVLTRLKNLSKKEGIPFQMVLQLFAQEEFLRKLSFSQYADNLILKGGMFIYSLTEFDSRPTRDIDFLIKNLHGSLENIEQTIRDICNISKMAEVIGVSEAQLRFVTNTSSGKGLLKCGSVVIPFDNQVSKDTDLYKLYNTNIHEKIAEQKAKEKDS